MDSREFRVYLAIVTLIALVVCVVAGVVVRINDNKTKLQKECILSGGSWTATMSPRAEYCVMNGASNG